MNTTTMIYERSEKKLKQDLVQVKKSVKLILANRELVFQNEEKVCDIIDFSKMEAGQFTFDSVLISESEKCNWDGKTILLVEDEVYNHAYAEQLLTVTKVNLLHAWDGYEAVELVKNHPNISLVLMDIKMPVMDGYEATRLIKQIRPKLPVIAQTAYALSQEKKQALEAGCDNYISKPIDKDLFMRLLSSYLI